LRTERPAALVTGASRGIGRAIALELAKTHRVFGTFRSASPPESPIELIRSDISSTADRESLVAKLRTLTPRLDLLVNNAGIGPRQRRDILESTEESFDELIAINLKGAHFLTQSIARWMLEDEAAARIVFVTSISAYTASASRAEYCISKAGLSMSAALYATRLAPHNVRVFEIRPGIIRTDMIAAVEQKYKEKIAAGLLPQPRMGEPTDVARAVRAIADGLLDYSAGQILDVDGGFHLRSL
jgi:3-oxoacyl-[acyl-carrier protein] reductase